MKAVVVVLFSIALLAGSVNAQTRPDFSGVWRLDKQNSHSTPLAADLIIITQTDTDLRIATLRNGQDGRVQLYRFDGGVTDNPTSGATAGNALALAGTNVAKSKAHWDGTSLVLDTDMGSVHTTGVMRLEADRNTFTSEVRGGPASLGDPPFHSVYRRVIAGQMQQ